MELFDDPYGQDNSEIEDVDITQINLYFSRQDVVTFKKYCKELMKQEFANYIEDGNISLLLFKIVKEKYETLYGKESADTGASRELEINFPG